MIERLLTRLLGVEEINGNNRCPTYLFRWTIWEWIPWRSYVKGDQSHIADKMRACP